MIKLGSALLGLLSLLVMLGLGCEGQAFPTDVPLLSTVFDEQDLTFLSEREQAAFSGMEALVDSKTGLPWDIGLITPKGVECYDAKTSPTNIGLWIATVVAEFDQGRIPKKEAVTRLEQVVLTLEKMDKYRGFFFNWYNLAETDENGKPAVGGPTVGPDAQQFISSVDNANLTVPLMIAAAAFPSTEVVLKIQKLLADQDYGFFYREDWQGRPRINHGYYVDREERSPYDYGTFMTEARLLVWLAIVKGDVPDNGLLGYMKAVPTLCDMSTGKKLVAISSWGGSLFEELSPDLFLDEKVNAPHTLGENHRRVVSIHIDCAEPTTGLWGWSPSEDVNGVYTAAGIPCLGSGGEYPTRDVSPYSVLLAARYAPQTVLDTLRKMEQLNPQVYDPSFGYRDAISKDGQEVGPHLLSLDKGMEAIALFNLIQEINGRRGISKYLWDYLDSIGAWRHGRQLLNDVQFNESFYLD